MGSRRPGVLCRDGEGNRHRWTPTVAVAALLTALLLPASAQEALVPVIDDAPRAVLHNGDGVIEGHLEGGSPDQAVELQRRLPGRTWTTVATKPVDSQLRVTFRLNGLTRTASYRLAETDQAAGEVYSDRARIFVAPVPVLKRVTDVTRFKGRVVVAGRLRGGKRGQWVRLQRSLAGRRWTRVKTGRAGRHARVRFELGRPTKTARYRLSFRRRSLRLSVSSESMRARVRPKLRFHVRPHDVFENRRVVLAGALFPKVRGRRVGLQVRRGGRWATIARPYAGDGHFRAGIDAARPGRLRLRARFGGDRLNTKKTRKRRLNVYRPSPATYYGPGFYGNRTACGQTLHTYTLGVAHRTLACGTKIGILYGGRTITVRVIDRGPYGRADWDLTGASARRLGFSGRNYIGIIVGRSSPARQAV